MNCFLEIVPKVDLKEIEIPLWLKESKQLGFAYDSEGRLQSLPPFPPNTHKTPPAEKDKVLLSLLMCCTFVLF